VSSEPEERAPDHQRLLSRVMGLAVACPFSQDNPDRCQLCAARALPMVERIEWVHGLSPGELTLVVCRHETCLHALERLAKDEEAGGA